MSKLLKLLVEKLRGLDNKSSVGCRLLLVSDLDSFDLGSRRLELPGETAEYEKDGMAGVDEEVLVL